MTRIELLPQDHATPDSSWLVLVLAGLVLGVCFVSSLVSLVDNLRRLQAIRRAKRGELPGEGRLGVLLGEVALAHDDEGEGPPVVSELRFHHHDVPHQRGQVARHWSAGPLETRARPFELVLASGERVRVEPGEHVRLLDELEILEATGPERVKAARLMPGEQAQIMGRLEARVTPGAGYRGSQRALVLRPPGDDGSGELWVASHDALLGVTSRRVGGYTFWLVAFVVVGALVRVAANDFLRLHREGRVLDAVAEKVEAVERKRKNGVYYEHYLTASHPSAQGKVLRGEVHAGKLDELLATPLPKGGSAPVREGVVTPFLVVPTSPAIHTLGTRPGATHIALLAQGVLAMLSLVFFVVARAVMKPWWEKSSHDYTELLSAEQAKVPLVRRPAADEDE